MDTRLKVMGRKLEEIDFVDGERTRQYVTLLQEVHQLNDAVSGAIDTVLKLEESDFFSESHPIEYQELIARYGESDLFPLLLRQETRRIRFGSGTEIPPEHRLVLRNVDLSVTPETGPMISEMLNLRSLHVGSFGGTPGKQFLPFLRDLKYLKTLDLNALWEARLDSLPTMASLRDLHLDNSGITNAGLADLKAFPRLKRLRITQSPDLEDLSGLASVKDSLEELELSTVLAIRDDALESIGDLRKLRVLHLGNISLSGKALDHLAGLPELEELSLVYLPDMSDGFPSLASLPRLRTLSMINMGLKLSVLSEKLPPLPQVETLDLSWNYSLMGKVDELVAFLRTHFPSLKTFRFCGPFRNPVPAAEAQALQDALPEVQVTCYPEHQS